MSDSRENRDSATLTERFAQRNPSSVRSISRHQLLYSIIGLMIGALCILGGSVLFLGGIMGSTSWTANLLGFETTLTDAAPGAVFAVVGLMIIFITRYVLNIVK